MRIDINTTAQIGKGLSIKREKGENDIEIVVAHLKFSDAFVQREAIDQLLGLYDGWSHALFDDLGAPVCRMDLVPTKFAAAATGKIKGAPEDAGITLTEADITDVVIRLADKGAMLSGTVSWLVAGDEASDAEPLIGRLCMIHWILQDAGQGDLLRAA